MATALAQLTPLDGVASALHHPIDDVQGGSEAGDSEQGGRANGSEHGEATEEYADTLHCQALAAPQSETKSCKDKDAERFAGEACGEFLQHCVAFLSSEEG